MGYGQTVAYRQFSIGGVPPQSRHAKLVMHISKIWARKLAKYEVTGIFGLRRFFESYSITFGVRGARAPESTLHTPVRTQTNFWHSHYTKIFLSQHYLYPVASFQILLGGGRAAPQPRTTISVALEGAKFFSWFSRAIGTFFIKFY